MVVFRSPINEDLAEGDGARATSCRRSTTSGEKTSVYTRKAPYSFGWDWGPRFVTCGVWKPVRLEAWDDARIVDVAVRQKELGNDKAHADRRGRGRWRRSPRRGALPAATVEVDGRGRRRAGHPEGPRSRTAQTAHASPSRSPQPEAVVAERLRRAAPLHGHDAPARGRAGRWTSAATRIGLRTLELRRAEGRVRQELRVRGQRRARLRQGRQLDPGRQLPAPDHPRALRRPPRARRGTPT